MVDLNPRAHDFGVPFAKSAPPPTRTMPAEAVRYVLQQLDAAMAHLEPAHKATVGIHCARAELLFHAIGPLDVIPDAAPVKEAAE
jgi:hypothetical protein